jgi:hypothetical protein
MTKIVACNQDIKKIYYSGHTITKVYSCGGKLVYKANSDLFLSNRYNSGGTIINDRMTCEENEQYHWNGIITCDLIKQYSTGSPCESEGSVHCIDSVIGDCVITIDQSAYGGCSYLTGLTFSNSVTSIGNNAFKGCSSLPKAIIGNGVETIGNFAFSGCTNLAEVVIPSGVTSIGTEAFKGCRGLGRIGSGKGVTIHCLTPPTLGTDAFADDDTGGFFKIYVPSSAVNTYKAASGWSTYASYITAIP